MTQIESKRLLLRKFQLSDADDCFEYLSDKETCYMDGGYEPWLSKNESFYDLMNHYESQSGRLMIVLKEENKVIGTIYIRNSLFRVVSAYEIGYVISPKYRRNGYMKEALELLFSYLKNEGVKLITAKAYEHNVPSNSFLKSIGFIQEGVIVESFCHPIDGIGNLNCYYYQLNK